MPWHMYLLPSTKRIDNRWKSASWSQVRGIQHPVCTAFPGNVWALSLCCMYSIIIMIPWRLEESGGCANNWLTIQPAAAVQRPTRVAHGMQAFFSGGARPCGRSVSSRPPLLSRRCGIQRRGISRRESQGPKGHFSRRMLVSFS
jgi:hypothetical protein